MFTTESRKHRARQTKVERAHRGGRGHGGVGFPSLSVPEGSVKTHFHAKSPSRKEEIPDGPAPASGPANVGLVLFFLCAFAPLREKDFARPKRPSNLGQRRSTYGACHLCLLGDLQI